MQFIHESVNDFLLRNQRLQTLDLALNSNPIGISHNHLKACCMSYLKMKGLQLPKARLEEERLVLRYPFLEYASTFVLAHAEEAQARDIEQKSFVEQLQEQDEIFERVRLFHNFFEEYPGLRCTEA